MNKLDKILLFKDLEEITNKVNIKKEKLQIIIDLYLDELDESIENEEDKIKPQPKGTNNEEVEDNNDNESEYDYNKDIRNNKDIINIELPPKIKSIFNKIVKITHPDKIKNEEHRDEYIGFYRRVVDAKDSNNKHEILYVGYLLGIKDIYELSENDLGSIKKRIKELEMESRLIDNNSFWACYYTNDPKLKSALFQQIVNLKKNF